MIPGELFVAETPATISANQNRPTLTVVVQHSGDRPIQVGSHYHFFEVNRALHFDRSLAYGMRLNIPAGLAVRFEPGEAKEVTLTPLAGERMMWGHNGLVQGALQSST
jgi:urease beta subunit